MDADRKAEAERLFEELRTAIITTERTIRSIIEKRAWEPLGYGTFAEAWIETVGAEHPLAGRWGELVLAKMVEDGVPEDILLSIKGVGPRSVAAAREVVLSAGRAGVVNAKPISRRGTRAELPSRPYRITVEFTQAEREHFERLSSARGSSLAREAEAAIRNWFSVIQARQRLSA